MGQCEKLLSAIKWLDRGAALLPAQPGSKCLARGFGPYQKRIITPSGAQAFFGPRSELNLAVVLPVGVLGLDFDNDQVFLNWQEIIPTELTTTYHETTRRGWHVFYNCKVPKNLKLIDNVEIKQVLIVAPSVVSGYRYKAIEYPILEVEKWEDLLLPLLSKENEIRDPIANFSDAGSGATPAETKSPAMPAADDLVSHIKAGVSVYDLALSLTQLESSDRGAGRWYRGRCPFHKDNRPSFWVDVERGTWGCHACNIRGDVINLYALSRGITNQDSIRDLAGELRR